MKLKNLFFAITMAIGLFSCSNEESEQTVDSQEKSILIKIEGLAPTTKAGAPTGPVDGVNDGATAIISSVDVYVTDNGGTILRAGRISTADAAWANLTGAGYKFINVQPSASKVYVFGNLGAPTLAAQGVNISTVNLSKNLYQMLGTQTILYIGSDDSMTPLEEPVGPSQTIGTTYQAQVTLTPIVSRFQIKSISFQETGSISLTKAIGGVNTSATVGWTGFSADVLGIYMNNFYYSNNNRIPSQLLSNTTGASSLITGGNWLFSGVDYANVASYNNYDASTSTYTPLVLPQTLTNKCYAFNFFPENLAGSTPKIHLQLKNVSTVTLTSSNLDVYNPSLLPSPTDLAYVNIVRYLKSDLSEMTAADFKAGKLYNFDIVVQPPLTQTDLQRSQFNVWIIVTVQPWSVETLIPGIEAN